MKILHCADIHLDSPMETHMTREQAATRNTEILKSFQRMTEYAAREKIKLVLIAGDFFDGERVTRRTVDGILDAVTSTPQIDYLYVSGNHDNWTNAFIDYEVPVNFKCFTDKWDTFTYGDVSVSSIEMTKANAEMLYEQLPRQNNVINIVMLHGQTSTVSGVDNVNLTLLKNKNIQYLALDISINILGVSWIGMEFIVIPVVWKVVDLMSVVKKVLSFWILMQGKLNLLLYLFH